MPTDASGGYRMNAQIARSPLGGKKAAAPADPNADPGAAAGQEESVTITKKADGSGYTYSDSQGQTQDVPDFASAMAQAQQCFGEAGDGDQDDQGAAVGADQGGAGAPTGGGMGY